MNYAKLHPVNVIPLIIIPKTKSLECFGTNNNVNLNLVPGHERYGGNERADHLAKLGSLKYPLNPIYNNNKKNIKKL